MRLISVATQIRRPGPDSDCFSWFLSRKESKPDTFTAMIFPTVVGSIYANRPITSRTDTAGNQGSFFTSPLQTLSSERSLSCYSSCENRYRIPPSTWTYFYSTGPSTLFPRALTGWSMPMLASWIHCIVSGIHTSPKRYPRSSQFFRSQLTPVLELEAWIPSSPTSKTNITVYLNFIFACLKVSHQFFLDGNHRIGSRHGNPMSRRPERIQPWDVIRIPQKHMGSYYQIT